MKNIPHILLLALALPLAAFAQNAPKKAVVISSYRIEPKPGHSEALKAALAAHAQRFHQGDTSWRVGEIMSGPDGGMYHIVEGPTTWTALDGRGDISGEHTKDYEANIAPHVAKTMPDTYGTYQEELSTVAAKQWSNKVVVTHLVLKPGRGADAQASLKKWKQIYEKVGRNIAVWHSAFSGESTYSLVGRLKDGFKDFDADGLSTRKACDELFGPDEWSRLQAASAANYSKIWSELIEFKPELGSK